MWVDKILTDMESKWGVKRLTGQFHDEYITCFTDTMKNRQAMEKITLDAIEYLNGKYYLRRKLGCDVQFGYNYSEIH